MFHEDVAATHFPRTSRTSGRVRTIPLRVLGLHVIVVGHSGGAAQPHLPVVGQRPALVRHTPYEFVRAHRSSFLMQLIVRYVIYSCNDISSIQDKLSSMSLYTWIYKASLLVVLLRNCLRSVLHTKLMTNSTREQASANVHGKETTTRKAAHSKSIMTSCFF